jgi:hypothetical protein
MEILGLRVREQEAGSRKQGAESREQEAGSREQENKYIGKSFLV